jgi:serine/threonine-protein kinase
VEPRFEENDEFEANFVFDQDPAAGREIDADAPIILFVSQGEGLIAIPAVVGLTVDEARARLESDGFRVGQVTEVASDDVEAGRVVRQVPASGEERPRDTAVDLEVSSGVEQIAIPNVVGETEGDARVALVRLELEPVVQQEASSDVEIGRVIRTEPAAGASVPKGGTVTLFVSSGPQQVEIPTLESIGSTDPDVVEPALQQLGFTTRRFDVELGAGDDRDGQVLGLVPSPGTLWPVGDEVLIRIGRAAPEPTTTTAAPTTEPPATTTPPTTPTS